MDDRAMLLKAILASPDEDTPRLMYADEIEGESPEYAEFIRVQCELARRDQFGGWECEVCGARPRPVDDFELGEVEHGRGCYVLFEDGGGSEFIETEPEFKALRDRECRLRKALYWLGPFVELHRGFGRAWAGPADVWLKYADELLSSHPIRRVRFTTTQSDALDAVALWEHADGAWRSNRWPGITFDLPPAG